MSGDTTTNVLIGLLLLVWILFRQVQARPVKHERVTVVSLVLVALGVLQVAQYAGGVRVPAGAWAALGVSLALGAVLGVVRGATVHVWRAADGQLMRQGHALTLVLWVVSIAQHVALDLVLKSQGSVADRLGAVSLLLYLGITLATQRAVIAGRGRELEHGARAARGVRV